MKNKLPNCLFIFSLCIFLLSVYIYQNKPINKESSSYFPENNIVFENHTHKLKKEEKLVIKLLNGEENKIKYRNEDSSKIQIISSSHQGLIIKRISTFTNEICIKAYNISFPSLNDTVYFTCYNDIVFIEKMFFYQIGVNDKDINSFINLDDGIFYFEFKIEKLLENKVYEEESIKDFCNILEEFFNSEIEIVDPLYFDLCFKININIKKVFLFETRKTLVINIDSAKFLYTFVRPF